MGDYNRCVEENIKLKENNTRLTFQRQTLQQKLDILTKKLDNFITL